MQVLFLKKLKLVQLTILQFQCTIYLGDIMETTKTIICSKCLEKINDERICPLCGNDNSVDNPAQYLRAFTMLQDKYIIGKLISFNGEHALYIAFDVEQKAKVFVKEFAPTVMFTRSENGSVTVKQQYEAEYKSLMSDFYDLHKKLAMVKNDIVVPINEILGENNTVYIVYKYDKYTSLESYISNLGEDLTPEETYDIFIPFIESLAALHDEGIVHCGISPETVFVDKQCNLRLLAFDTYTGRTLKSDMDVQLFDGFSAPEQYSLRSWLGTWTDVYSVASVLYYCMTSIRPPHAIDRHKRDTVVPSHNVNNQISRSVSAALEKAMRVNTEKRTQTIEEFLKDLSPDSSKFNIFQKVPQVKEFVPSVKEEKPVTKETTNSYSKPFPYMLVSTIVTVVVLTICGSFLFRSLFGTELDAFMKNNFGFDSTSSKREDLVGNIPNFVGQKFSDVKSNKENRDLYTFEEKYEFNEDYEEGIVVSQTPDSSALIANTYKITLVISKGSVYTTVPDIISMDMGEAMKKLTEAGITNFKFTRIEETGYSSGEVISCLPGVGRRFNKQKDYIEVICQK